MVFNPCFLNAHIRLSIFYDGHFAIYEWKLRLFCWNTTLTYKQYLWLLLLTLLQSLAAEKFALFAKIYIPIHNCQKTGLHRGLELPSWPIFSADFLPDFFFHLFLNTYKGEFFTEKKYTKNFDVICSENYRLWFCIFQCLNKTNEFGASVR